MLLLLIEKPLKKEFSGHTNTQAHTHTHIYVALTILHHQKAINDTAAQKASGKNHRILEPI